MKSLLAVFAVLAASGLVFAATPGCNDNNSGTSASACVTAACGGNTSTYQACDNGSGTVAYTFGSTSCSCTAASDPLGCTTCKASLATYCNVTVGGSSSSSGSGSSTSSGSGSSSGSSGGGDASTDSAGEDGGGDDAESSEGSTGDSSTPADGGVTDTGTPSDSGGG